MHIFLALKLFLDKYFGISHIHFKILASRKITVLLNYSKIGRNEITLDRLTIRLKGVVYVGTCETKCKILT